MSSLITAVFKATIGMLVNKGRDKLAEKLNEGDVTDQKFRGLIVREIDEIKSNLFKEGIELLYEVFESARPSTENRAIEAAATASVEQFDIAKEMRKLQLTALDESATRKLITAKETFSEARLEAMRAFSNEALELPDRLLAMQYRLMATILRNIDNPTDALAACRVCLDELHQVPAVKEYFKVELEEGLRLRARFNKDERRQIIFSVCHANRVIYDVMSMLGSVKRWTLPYMETGKEKVDPLRNERVVEVLAKQGKEHCCVTPWSLGQEGEEEHKLKIPRGIATNHRGQFLIADNGDKTVKVFDSNGKFDFRFNPQTDDADKKLYILDVTTAGEDNKIYLLVGLKKPGAEEWEREVRVFNKTADLQHKFLAKSGDWNRLTVSSAKQHGKILLLAFDSDCVVHVHEPTGEFICSFGGGVFEYATDITATCDGRVMIVDRNDDSLYIFDVEGHQLGKFNIKHERDVYYCIACHPVSDQVVVAGHERETYHLKLAIYTVNGEFVRRIQLDEKGYVNGTTVTVEGHIAVAFRDKSTDKEKTVSVAAEMGKLEKTDFNETMKNFFFQAKKRFETARNEATKASNNEALKIFDRITAIRYRVMATVLESVVETVGTAGDMSPSSLKTALTNALPECEECLQKLHSFPAVQDNFKVELDKAVLNVRGRYGKDERRKIISTVCQINRAIYNATRAVGRDALVWPFVDTGEDKVDPLRDGRISKVLHKVKMEHCSLLWSFGQEGEEEHKLKDAWGIATNHRGQFLIADNGDKTVKVFDSNGKLDFRFNPQTDDADTKLDILDVATAGEDDRIYLLVGLKKPGAEEWENEVQVFNKTADLQHKFPVRRRGVWGRLTVTSGKKRGKILLLTGDVLIGDDVVDIHESSGEFVCSFGGGVFKDAQDITATCDGRVMIVDRGDDSLYIFDVEGHQLGKFNIKHERDVYYRIAYHPASADHVVLAGRERETLRLTLAIYT
ncbi:unnamed protein product, partial [Porites lobata]